MRIRKLTADFGYGEMVTRYDFILNGAQKHLINMSDEEAINAIRSMGGRLSEVKPFKSGSIKQEWIDF